MLTEAYPSKTLAAETLLPFDERVFMRDRMLTVQQEIAHGEHGEPLLFLASKEIEFLLDSGSIYAAIGLPSSVQHPADEAAREAKIAELRLDAVATIGQLVPTTAAEAQKKQRWLDSIPNFTVKDWVNYLVYKRFSTPTLASPKPPKGISYDEMLAYSQAMGMVEWRFGPETHQRGYYDGGAGLGEIRLTPGPPEALDERETLLRTSLADAAAELGLYVLPLGDHLNISAYQITEQNGQRHGRPIIGSDAARIEQTLRVVSGLNAAISDCVYISISGSADLLDDIKNQRITPRITTHRTQLRVVEDYIEARNSFLRPSNDHALLWLMSGMAYGLAQPRERLAALGYPVAELIPTILVEHNERFDKTKHVNFKRALEDSTLEPDGSLVVHEDYVVNYAYKFARSIFGEQLPNQLSSAERWKISKILGPTFMYSLFADGDGQLRFDPALFSDLLGDRADKVGPGFKRDILSDPTMVDAARVFMADDPLRIRVEPCLSATAARPELSPAEWQARWIGSEVMRLAYGEHTSAHATRLRTALDTNMYTDL
ncbi:MAG TPA: hypothetical protein VLF91_05275 [Candidatus Saccharimonadales bacterium]|nr:hypothetical protein [Candidatus Saccharimonadales bacterium]